MHSRTKHQVETFVGNLIDRHATNVGQVANGREDGKTTDEGEHTVGTTDDDRVQEGWFAARTVRTVGRHSAKSHGEREEDLRDSTRPHVGFLSENFKVPFPC